MVAEVKLSPTIWRLGVRCWWGGWSVLELPDCCFPEDALEAYEASYGNCQRVARAEFWCRHEQCWKQVSEQNLQAAIALVQGAKS